MKSYLAKDIRNIVLLGHSGSGKTTYTEAALYYSGSISRFGKVENGNTVSDYEQEEIRRKASIHTSVIPVEWRDTKINFLDTPGYYDFSGEAKLAISVADTALIFVSAKSGVEVGTERAFAYTEQFALPKMIFINQMDDEHADFQKALRELRERFGKSVAPLQIPFYDDENKPVGFINLIKRDARVRKGDVLVPCDMPENMKETVEELRAMIVEVAAESDDALLDKYFNEEELTLDEIYAGLKAGIMNRTIAPVMCGAAAVGLGVKLLLSTIVKFIPPSVECRPSFSCIDLRADEHPMIRYNSEREHFAAFVFKTISDPYMGKLNVFRILSGTLKKDRVVYNSRTNAFEKLSHIYVLRGKEQIEVEELLSGDIGVAAKLNDTSTQDTLSSRDFPVMLPKVSLPASNYTMAIVTKGKGDENKIAIALAKLQEEDPTVHIAVSQETKQTLVSGVGNQQLEILVNQLRVKYKIEVELVAPVIPYRETIKAKAKVQGRYKKQSGGHGQYGDIWMEFEPSGDHQSSYVFEEKVFGGAVPKQYFPAVEKGIQECVQHGVLAGYPVVGIKATLVDGSYHPVDSSEMAFKMATSLAFKDGMAKANPIILEPILHVEILAPEQYMGDIMGDINKRRGRILSMNPQGAAKLVTAEVPQAEMHQYGTDLRSITQSRGEFTTQFSRYEEAPFDIQQKIIATKQQ